MIGIYDRISSRLAGKTSNGEEGDKIAIMSINMIKLIALVCMLIDHIGEFIPQSPLWFRYIGRLAAPLFFSAVHGDFTIQEAK